MIIGVGAWRGTGATTTALLLAWGLAQRGGRPWLIEADAAGGTLAARVPGLERFGGTLEHVAFSTRRLAASDRFGPAAAEWNGVRVVTGPGDPFRAWACHRPRQPWAAQLRELDGPVIIDVGRLRSGTPTTALLQQLDALLLVTSSDPVSIVTTTEWAAQRGRTSPEDPGVALDIARLVVIDRADRSRRRDRADSAHRATQSMVESELGDRLAGWMPWSSVLVDVVERGGSTSHRRLRNNPGRQALDVLLDRIGAWMAPLAAAVTAPLTDVLA